MSENNSIVAIDKEILTMMDFDKFNSLYSVSRHLSFTFGEIPPEIHRRGGLALQHPWGEGRRAFQPYVPFLNWCRGLRNGQAGGINTL